MSCTFGVARGFRPLASDTFVGAANGRRMNEVVLHAASIGVRVARGRWVVAEIHVVFAVGKRRMIC